MNNKFALLIAISVFLVSCHKASDTPQAADFTTLEAQVITDFANNTAVPLYADLKTKATTFNNAIVQLNTDATETNLVAARQAWVNMRSSWEQCEGFLFGPVEDDNYDPNMDTWPVDHVQLDSLLSSSNSLELPDIQNLTTLSLRGFHPVEYMIWGVNGNATASSLTARQKKYMVSLSADIANNTANLYGSWTSGVEFRNEILNAGKGSTRFTTRKDLFLAMVSGMSDICGEVGEGKMSEPFTAHDSLLSESPFSHNSLTDFKNNIVGAQQVYLCNYNTQGKGLSDMVKAKNASLDAKIRQQFTAAINSFNNITTTFEQAIYTQQVQVQNTISAIASLQTTLDEELSLFIQQHVKD